jgi:drug/metabolite transporter (DMT)-like permease
LETEDLAGRRSSARLAAYLRLALPVVAWAVNWPLLKLGLADIAPFTFTALRLFGSVVIFLAVLAALRRPLLPPRGERASLALSGFLQMGLLLGLSVLGLQFIGAGRAAVLAYTMQLWAIPIGFLVAGERPSRLQLLGALGGFAGLLLFFNPGLLDWRDPRILLGNFLLICGAWSWGLGATLYRRRRYRSDFLVQTAWQLGASTVPVAALALALEWGQPIRWSPFLVGFLLYNWAIGVGLAYLFWIRALRDLPPATAGQAVMLVPVIAFFVSAAMFGERITWDVLASVALIIGGLTLTLSERR